MSTQSLISVEATAGFIELARSHRNRDFVASEMNYMQAIAHAETIYGAYHGEIGILLIKLADLYRRYGYYEEAIAVEERIAEIAAIYLEDQQRAR